MKNKSVTGERKGFTLIELLTVIAIIGILAGMLFAVGNAVRDSARASRANAEISAIETALTRFDTEFGFFPEIAFLDPDSSGDRYPLFTEAEGAYVATSRALFYAVQGVPFFGDQIPDGFEEERFQRSLVDLNSSQVDNINEVMPDGIGPRNSRIVYHDPLNFNSTGPYLVDPWGFPYGYYFRSRADTNAPDSEQVPPFERGQRSLKNFEYFDVWSTRDAQRDHEPNRWITNWEN